MAALMLLPAVADAQLGGFIKKKVGERVADKVLGDQGGKGAPKFSETVLEIDSDRLDQLVRGVDAEAAAHRTAMAPFRDYEAGMEARQNAAAEKARCEEAATAEYNVMATGIAARVTAGAGAGAGAEMAAFHQRLAALPEKDRDALMARQEKFAEQLSAANDRGDTPAALRIGNAARADMEKTVGMPMPTPTAAGGARVPGAEATRMEAVTNKMQADLAKCPKSLPPEPERPDGYGTDNHAVRDSITAAAVRASGLTAAQFSNLRERVSGWLALRAGKEDTRYVFTPAESAVLEGREADLKRREKALLGELPGGGWRF